MYANRLIREGMMWRTHDLLMKAHPVPVRNGHDITGTRPISRRAVCEDVI